MTRQHSPETIAQALSHVPAHDRDTWIAMGMAIKSELGEGGFDIWNEWSLGGDSYKERDAKAAWRSIRANGTKGIGSLFYEAMQHGFKFNGHGKPYDAAEIERLQREREERIRQEEAARAESQEKAAKLAEEIYNAAQPAKAHPYLERKGITAAPGVRVGRWYQVGDDGKRYREKENCLLIPIRDENGKLWNLQAIFQEEDAELERDRDYLSEGRKHGCYFAIGKPNGELVTAEGFATAQSVRQATGHAVCVAFDKGNLVPVMKALRAKLPEAKLIAAADNDIREGKPNYGLEAACGAASAVGGLVAVPDLDGEKCDFNDLFIKRGPEAVKAAIVGALPPAPKEKEQGDLPGISSTDQDDDWPAPLASEAFYGLAGEIVKEIEPQTESDEAAVLLQVLAAFGALVGRGPHVRVEGDEHHSNLFVLIVGDTAKARKGTSWSRVRELFSTINDWPNVVHGLSSGEGLKWAVRDRITKNERNDKTGYVSEVEVDPGISDKRVLVVESEFAQVLRQCSRAGNTLSSTIRCAWDGIPLQSLTKQDSVKATGAHIGIVGHITADELRAELTQTDGANGFANRFLFMCSRRSKYLPFGGRPMSSEVISHFASRLAAAAGKARQRSAIEMDDDARDIWGAVYRDLSEGQLGMYGAVTARAEAQSLRLALAYALLDEAEQIRPEHVLAALAIWQRAGASARTIWKATLGDPKADEIHRALVRAGAEGMTRTSISGLFNRHESTERIGAALELLRSRGMARCERVPTRGAPVETWYASDAKQANKAKEGTYRMAGASR